LCRRDKMGLWILEEKVMDHVPGMRIYTSTIDI
jgi:hypothetical protein